MFGADLAYMDNCIDEEYGTESLLPEYLYPTFRVTNPWHRQSNKTQLESDIIVIAEFSELEGPKPVITIPNDRDTHFDINDFTVRIMSVDQGSSGQQSFHMPEDSQVLMSDTKENVYAFVHQFVLLDKQARGYSRPFAISYVTPDQRKLLNFYEEISTNFKKIARYLKYGNKLVFKNDLDKFMIDLQYTKDQMVSRYRSTIQPGQTDLDNKLLQSLKTLESQISEVQGILGHLNPTLNDKRMEQRFSKIEERAQINKTVPKSDSTSLQEWESIESPDSLHFASLGSSTEIDNLLFFDSQHYKPKLVEISKGRKFDLHLRGLHELCSWGAKEGLQKLRHIYQYFQQDISVLQMEKKDLSLLDPPSGLVTFGNKLLAANFMTNIDKICISTCCFMRVPGTRSNIDTRNLLNRSWSSNDTLSSFKSVPSSFQSFNEDEDSDSMLSATSELGVYMQRTNSLGSFQLIGSFDSFGQCITPPMNGFILDSNPLSLPEDTSALTSNLEKTLLASDLSEKQENKSINEDLYKNMDESLNKCLDSSLDLSSSNEKTLKNTNLPVSNEVTATNLDSYSTGSSDNIGDVTENDSESSCERDRSKTIRNNESYHIDQNTATQIHNRDDYSLIKTELSSTSKDPGEKLFSSGEIENLGDVVTEGLLKCQNCPLGEVDSSSGVSSCDVCQHKLSQNLKSDDSVKQNMNFNRLDSKAESEQCSKTDIFGFNTPNDLLSPGFGIMKVLQTYSNIHNVIYSLLIGRTVVVIGTSVYEEEIKQLVTALKLFLPGCHRCPSGHVLWSSKRITVTDLEDLKLIGICRHEKKSVDRMIPKSVQNYITLFDLDRRLIKSPVYKGSLITTILSRTGSFKTEESYINFIKVSLCDFSCKAFILFHSFCLGSVGTLTSDKSTVISESDCMTTTSFLKKLGVQYSDVNIVEYLTELVKYQHIEDHYKSLNETGVPPRPIYRDVRPCQEFRC